MKLAPYPKYKPSGVEWLGEIPAHWSALPIKRVCRLCYGESLPADARANGEVVVFGSNGPVGTHDSANTGAPCLIVGRKGSFGKVNYSADAVFAIDTTFLTDARYTKGNLRWLYHTLQCAQLDTISKDSAIPGLDREDAYAHAIAVSPIHEQRAIAAFLDRETAKIDGLLARKERLIELLQEKRAALITRAVTRGLDPNVPMKDSSIEWLGEIPAHWDVKRIKWVARMESGHTPDKKVDAYWNDGDIPWVSLNDTGHLKNQDYISDTEYYTNELGLKNSSARLLPPRSVIFSRDATIGLCAITGRSMAVSQHFIAWICNEALLPEYLLRVFDAMQRELAQLTMGATLRTIGMSDVKTLTTPVPPLPEQKQIVAYIRKETVAIDTLIAKVRQAIDLLKEFRTALISATVTGKIDVQEEAP